MSFIDKNLLTDEQILYRSKKNLIIFLIPVIWLIATLACLINDNPYVVKLSLLPAIAGAFSWGSTLLTYVTSEFVVTNKRIMMKEGFFFRHSTEVRLATVSQISVTQSLLGQLFNYGTIFINPFGGETDSFTEIDGPYTFQKQVQEQLNQSPPRFNPID